MKTILSVTVLLFAIHLSYGQIAPKKTCEDFLPDSTCDSLKKLASVLKEASSTIQDAIDAGVQVHIQTGKEMLAFVKKYIADRIDCAQIMSQDKCTVLFAVAERLKLTKEQVKIAIEMAVNGTKATAAEIYKRTLKFLTEDINCEKILGADACNKMLSALDKFHEQRILLKDAIMSAVLKHYSNAKELLNLVQTELIPLIKNFKCDSVLTPELCSKLISIASNLKILPGQVKEAIELAVLNGITTAQDVYKFAIAFLTDLINCDTILSPITCQNLVDATKKLHEQAKLIKEAIMDAALKKISDATDLYIYVRNKVIENVKNFQCTDVIPQLQCDFLKKLAQRFHIRTSELRRVIIETIVNGTRSAQQIYDATINALIEEAKNLKCEEMIDASLCQILDAFAANLRESVQDVNDAVRRALAQGKSTVTEIKHFVKTLLVDEKSCRDLFHSYLICKSLKLAAWVKGVTFDVVINKLREYYANGITTIRSLKDKITRFIKDWTPLNKRSIDAAGVAKNTNEVVDVLMQILGGIGKFSEKVKENIKAELIRLVQDGKLKVWQYYAKLQELIQKYNPLSDELSEDVPADYQDLMGKLKAYGDIVKEYLKSIIEAISERLNLEKGEREMLIAQFHEATMKDIQQDLLSLF